MSRKGHSPRSAKSRAHAPIFAALGDTTRLALVARLSGGDLCSIAQLTEGFRLTRQAITKHLRVLERAGIIHGTRRGRESVFAFNPEPLEEAKSYLDLVSEHWDQTLARLMSLVEDEPSS